MISTMFGELALVEVESTSTALANGADETARRKQSNGDGIFGMVLILSRRGSVLVGVHTSKLSP
jgi:hypothetical protein